MRRVILFLMTEKGLEVLREAVSTNKDLIEAVVIGTDKNVVNDFSEEIREFAQSQGVPFFERNQFKYAHEQCYALAVSWRWMIEHPEDKLVVFHDSLLPKYRGFAPLVNMLINGENRIGVTALFGSSQYDRGDILLQQSTPIKYPLKINNAINLINHNYRELVRKIFKILEGEGKLVAEAQDESQATYSIWRDSLDYYIDWQQSASQIKRFIDAVGYPYDGAKSKTNLGFDVKITEVEIVPDINCEIRHVGKVVFVEDGMPVIICGEGLLRIKEAYEKVDNGDKSLLPLKSFRVRFY